MYQCLLRGDVQKQSTQLLQAYLTCLLACRVNKLQKFKHSQFFIRCVELAPHLLEPQNFSCCHLSQIILVYTSMHYCNAIATLLQHYCNTIATLLQHYCITIATLLQYYYCNTTIATLLLQHYCNTIYCCLLYTSPSPRD